MGLLAGFRRVSGCTLGAVSSAAAIARVFFTLLSRTAAAFLAIFATLLTIAARNGRLVLAIALAGLPILATAARGFLFPRAACRFFPVRRGHGVMRAASGAVFCLR